jgi:Phosphotransferase enzyme family
MAGGGRRTTIVHCASLGNARYSKGTLMRTEWAALPESVRVGITERAGGTDVVPAQTGDHTEFAATITAGSDSTVFVKAALSELGARFLRQEVALGEALDRPFAPKIRWHFSTAGWLVVGFEHCGGRHADLSPGSEDLGPLAAALEDLCATPVPDVGLLTPAARLGFPLTAADGSALVHTDLNPANLIVTPGGLRIVDWAWATKAAGWVELALLAPWLIGSGHTPEQAQGWLTQQRNWNSADRDVLDEFAQLNATKWVRKAQANLVAWTRDLADWTGQWASYRTNRTS